MEFFMNLFWNIVLPIYILLIGKCCFEESFVLDKKSIVLNLVTAVIHSLVLCLFGENSIPYSSINLLSALVVGWTILRGGKGVVRRIAAILQIFFLLIMPVAEIVEVFFIPFNESKLWNEKMDIVLLCLCFVEAVYVYWILYRKKIYIRFQVTEKIALFFVAIFVWVSYAFMLVCEEDFHNLKTGFLLLFILTLMVMYYAFLIAMVKNKTSAYYQQGQKRQEEWMRHELTYFKEYKKSQEETRRFRHDVTNNLTCISALLQEGKQEEAQQYLCNMLGEIRAFSPKVVTGEEMLDCIISVKWELMVENGIVFQVDGVLDRGLKWEPIDICTVFSNALDNAIEACQKVSEEKVILLSFKRTRNFYCIEIKNSINKELVNIEEIRSGKSFTTKIDKEFHGFGLENIEKIIRKHNGQLELNADEKYFILRMIIPG